VSVILYDGNVTVLQYKPVGDAVNVNTLIAGLVSV